MPELPGSNSEIEVVLLEPDQDPPSDEMWILVVGSPQHAFGETKVHSRGQTHLSPLDDLVMSIYNAQQAARDLGMTRIYVKGTDA